MHLPQINQKCDSGYFFFGQSFVKKIRKEDLTFGVLGIPAGVCTPLGSLGADHHMVKRGNLTPKSQHPPRRLFVPLITGLFQTETSSKLLLPKIHVPGGCRLRQCSKAPCAGCLRQRPSPGCRRRRPSTSTGAAAGRFDVAYGCSHPHRCQAHWLSNLVCGAGWGLLCAYLQICFK